MNNKLQYVTERDIDFLILEELNVCMDFASWLFACVSAWKEDVPDCVGAWHSVTHPQFGESDLIVKYQNDFAILIENKIDAPAQPEQAARYKRRGEEGIYDGDWKSFVTCIVAPERYLQGNSEAKNYNFCVSYEQIRNFFKNQNSKRSSYRAYVLDEAIEQNRRGYSPVIDNQVTQFWLSYWELSSARFPLLEMPRPGIKPANSDWPYFRPREFGIEMCIVHKMAQGYVDLQVLGAAEKLVEIRSLIKEPNLEVVVAGKSAAVRVIVTPVDRFGSFEDQRSSVIDALNAAERLSKISKCLKL